jgi:hypothetical protein|tara:strand:+ start:1770 stop:2015 length:246 start_codon:yes stop_codon:yes gene_type:complete
MIDNENILFANGFEEAFVGIVRSCGEEPKACYDYDKCIEVLISRDKMSYEEAIDFFEFNVIGAYVGEHTPAFLESIALSEI